MASRNAFYAPSGRVSGARGVLQTARRHRIRLAKFMLGAMASSAPLTEDLIHTSVESEAAIAALKHTRWRRVGKEECQQEDCFYNE
jgi:hypothetical protein